MTVKTLGELAPTLKVGQRVRVTFEGVATVTGQCGVGIARDDGALTFYPPLSALAEVLPDPIKAGDRVRWAGHQATVEHMARDQAWVVFDDGDETIVPLFEMGRIP
jgi:hypothetical protein